MQIRLCQVQGTMHLQIVAYPSLILSSPSPANDAEKNDEMTVSVNRLQPILIFIKHVLKMSQEEPIVNPDVYMPPQMQSNEAVQALIPTQVCPPPLVPTQLNDHLEDGTFSFSFIFMISLTFSFNSHGH